MARRRKLRGGAPQLVATRDFRTYNNIYCFGDMEGQFPFMPIRKNLCTIVSEDETEVSYRARLSYFPVTTDGNQFIELNEHKHIIIRTSEQDACVFVGDLLDHGKYDIRWLMAFIYNPHPESILCCIGNRDYNKLRRIDESYICTYTGISIWDSVPVSYKTNLTAFVEYITNNWNSEPYRFAYTYNSIKKRFAFIKNDTAIKNIRALYNKFDDLIARTRDIYASRDTWGINEYSQELDFPNYNYDELVELGIIKQSPSHSIYYKCVLIHVTNMIMGVKWDAEIVAKFPRGCEILNGLYVDYLHHAHIYGKVITNHNNEVALISHGLVNKYISHPVGFPRDLLVPPSNVKNQDTNYEEFIRKKAPVQELPPLSDIGPIYNFINEDKNILLEQFNNYWNTYEKTSVDKQIRVPNYADAPFKESFYRFNDIYYERTPTTKIFENSEDIYNPQAPLQRGGASLQKAGTYFDDNVTWITTTEPETIIKTSAYDYKYNIYGHSPQGLVPDIVSAHDGGLERLYIGIDISNIGPYKPKETIQTYNGKLNAYLSTGAFSYIVFKPSGVKIRGVITKGNFIIDSRVKFPIKYSKTLDKFMAFKHVFTEQTEGYRDIRFVPKITYRPQTRGPKETEFPSKTFASTTVQ